MTSRRAGVGQSSCKKFVISWGFIPTSKVWPELLSQVLNPSCVHNFSCPQVKDLESHKGHIHPCALGSNSWPYHSQVPPAAGHGSPWALRLKHCLVPHSHNPCDPLLYIVLHHGTLIFPPQAPEDLRNLPRLGLSQQSHHKKMSAISYFKMLPVGRGVQDGQHM